MPESVFKTRPLPESPSVRAAVLAPIRQHFDDKRGRLETLFRQHGLDPKRLRDPYEAIPLPAYLRVFEDAAELASDPVLGARLGQRIRPADLGPMGLLMQQSGTIRAGFERFVRSVAALQSATDIQFGEEDGVAVFGYQIRDSRLRGFAQDTEFSLSATTRLIRMSFDPRWSPLEVHLEHRPSSRREALESIFRAPVRFRQGVNRLVLARDGLDIVHRNEDDALIALIERHVGDMAVGQEPRTVTDRVIRWVTRNLGQRPPTLEIIAGDLGLTRRTLQRRLSEEGTSLRRILEHRRRDIVEGYLANPDLDMKRVAAALGYSDQTVFWRAYRRWTGARPTDRRRG
tara:strand:+ start:369 stop:1400 length:1032 start_codon:yes stop_codon:yes gene_type:complete